MTRTADNRVKVISPSLRIKIMANLDYYKEDVLERTFKVYSLGQCRIIGYNSKYSWAPFVVQDESGKKYKTSKSFILVD